MNSKVLSRPVFFLSWFVLATTVYIAICASFYFIDTNFLKICTPSGSPWGLDVRCPDALIWYEITANSIVNIIGIIVFPILYAVFWIISIFLFKKGNKKVENTIDSYMDILSVRKKLQYFRLSLYFMPILLVGGICIMTRIQMEYENRKVGKESSYDFKMKNPRIELDNERYRNIAKDNPDLCQFSKDFYIVHSEVASKASYLHIPDNALSGFGLIFVSHENDWGGSSDLSRKYSIRKSEKFVSKLSNKSKIYIDDTQEDLANQTLTYVPGRRFDIRVALFDKKMIRKDMSDDEFSEFVSQHDVSINNTWITKSYYSPWNTKLIEFSRVFPNNTDCITVEVR